MVWGPLVPGACGQGQYLTGGLVGEVPQATARAAAARA